MNYNSIKTLGQLKASGYTTQSVKDEIRTNQMSWIREGKSLPGIIGYEDSVIPQLESALLAKHNVLFLSAILMQTLVKMLPTTASTKIQQQQKASI